LSEFAEKEHAKRASDALRELQLFIGKMIAAVPTPARTPGKIACGISAVSEQMIRDVTHVIHPYIPELVIDFGASPCGQHRKSVTAAWATLETI